MGFHVFVLGIFVTAFLFDNTAHGGLVIKEYGRDYESDRQTEYITITEHTPISRQKRDEVDHVVFPPIMDVKLNLRDQEVSLKLKQHGIMTPDIQLSDSDGAIEHEFARKAQAYEDEEKYASFVVKCEDDTEQCSLRGSMIIDGNMWDIAPDPDRSNIHTAVQKGDGSKINFGKKVPKLPLPDHHQAQPPLEGARGNFRDNRQRRHKRSIPNCDIVELIAIVDESIWEFYSIQSNFNTTAAREEIMAYYMALYLQTDAHFKNVGLRRNNTCIRLYLVAVHIQTTTSDSWSFPNERTLQGPPPDIAYVDAIGGMIRCGDQLNNLRSTYSIDLGQCFTRKDIVWNEGSGQNFFFRFYRSLGFREVCCDDTWLVYQAQVIEAFGDNVELLVAHEISHGLGGENDGISGCLDSDGYIMAEEVRINTDSLKLTNVWHFSTCTVDQIYQHLDLFPSCLRTNTFTEAEFDAFQNQPLAGIEYDWDKQCLYRFGNGSKKCDPTGQNRTYFNDMCSNGIFCTEVEFGDGSCTGQTRPLDGTTCGTFGSYCLEGACFIQLGNGENCTSHVECGTNNSFCSYPNNTCQCADGFYDDNGNSSGGECVEKVCVGEFCPQPDACIDPNSVCINMNCTCISGYYAEDGSCYPLKCAGEECDESYQCKGNFTECSGCIPTCRCPSDRYLNISTGDCDLKKELGSGCEAGQCEAINSVCGSLTNVCECQEGFFDTNGAATPGGNCTAKVCVGEFCPQPDACIDPNSVCINMNCTCNSGYYAEDGSCYPLKCAGEECDETYQCKGNFTECSGCIPTCRCPSDRYLNISTGDCDLKKELGSGCEAGQCEAINSVCGSLTNECECQEGFFDTNGAATPGGNCTAKFLLGEFCTEPDSCADSVAICSTACRCPTDFFNNNGTCERKKCVGESCFNATDCLGGNVECAGMPQVCQCPTGFYLNDSTANCDSKKDLGRACEDGECGPANSVCSSTTNVCECQEGFFDTDGSGTLGGNCTAKLSLGESCIRPDSCSDPVAICSSTCQCPSDFFNNNGSCNRKKCVGESCFNSTDCLGTNVECLGSPKLCQCPNGFYLNGTTADCDTKKDLGRACEDGECGPANSVCSSTTNVCECQEGFFDTDGSGTAGGNCTAKFSLGEMCSQSDSCADPVAICSSTCQCPTDFFNNNGTCERKKCVGESCFNSTDCLGTNVECLGMPKLCQCPNGFYLNDTTADCDTKKDLGRACEDGECGPANSVCSSTTNVCECQEGFFDTDGSRTPGGNCTSKFSLGEMCSQSDSCADPVAICSSTCQCPTDFFNNNGTCERKKCVGESCFNSTDCLGTNVECLGSPKLCQCPNGFYLNDTTADCDTKKDLGRACEDGECGPANSVCSSTTNVCECQEGFFDTDGPGTPGGNCTAKFSLGEMCSQSDSCADPVAICSSTCQCPTEFFNNTGACERKKCVGESCFNSTDCLGTNVECLGSPKLCQCPNGFYLNDTTADCDTKKDLGRACEDGECGPANSVCSSTTNVCACQEGFFDTDGSGTPGGNCTAKFSLGEMCSQSDSCADPVAICSSTCQCPTDFFNNNGACERKKCVGESCFNSTDCLGTNVECLGSPKLCQCPNGFYLNDTTADCDTKKDLGRACKDGECGPANSVCSSTTNVCECQEGFFDTDGSGTPGGNCTAKFSLGEMCSQSDSCTDPVAVCSSTCQCPSDFFNNNGACERKKCIGESCNNVTDCLARNVECSGSPKRCKCQTGFYLNDTTGDCDMQKALGESCSPGQCLGDAICNPLNQTCTCAPGFTVNGGNCTTGALVCPNSDFVTFESSCYLFGDSAVLYNPARTFCDTFDGSGLDSRLVQVDTTAENDFLTNFISTRALQPAFGYWNDLFQFNANGNESWRTTGDLLTIDGWAPGRPNGNDKYCTVFSKRQSYDWIDVDCATDIRGGSDGSTYFAICEIDLGG